MLRQLGHKFPPHEHPALLVGLDVSDDAAVYRLNAQQALVQTLDFFAPLVDDPYQFGAIAAVNAMNDVYAMGGEVVLALNIAAFPEDLPVDVVAAILDGGADKVREAGGVIAGGHTIVDEEPKYGLCVTGLVDPTKVRTNAAARPGDVVLLTKPLGTGLLISAIREGTADPAHAAATVEQMMTLNRSAARAAANVPLHASTDITGFGLAGHCWEVATNSSVLLELNLPTLPMLDGLEDAIAAEFGTGGQSNNREYFGAELRIDGELSPLEDALLFDPQTSGGLLFTLAPAAATILADQLTAAGVSHWQIGRVREGNGIRAVR